MIDAEGPQQNGVSFDFCADGPQKKADKRFQPGLHLLRSFCKLAEYYRGGFTAIQKKNFLFRAAAN